MKHAALFVLLAAAPALSAQEVPAAPPAPAAAPAPAAPQAAEAVRLLKSQMQPLGEYETTAAPAFAVQLLRGLNTGKLPIVSDEESDVTFCGILADFLLCRNGQCYILTMYRTPGWFRLNKARETEPGRVWVQPEGEHDGDFRDAALYTALMEGFHTAAEEGNTASQLLLARHYMSSCLDETHQTEHEHSQQRALVLFEQAARGGNATAQYNMGRFCAEGTGVARDNATALEWYHAAARQLHPGAIHELGQMTEQGRGVAANLQEALTYYKQAAELGHAESMVRLGEIYYNGEGVARDRIEGISWYCKANAQARVRARIVLDELNDLLEQQENNEAEDLGEDAGD